MTRGESLMTIRARSLENPIFSAVGPLFKKLFVSTSSTLLVGAGFVAAKKSLFAPRKSSGQETRANFVFRVLKSHFF
jgi:hypothetical protein